MTRKRLLVTFAAACVALVATGVAFRNDLAARVVAYRLGRATDDEARKALAEELISRGPAGSAALGRCLDAGPDEVRYALLDAVGQLPATDANFVACARVVFDAMPKGDDSLQSAGLALAAGAVSVPELAERAKATVMAALTGGPNAKAAACRFAVRFDLESAVVPLLNDANADVRKAAVIAVGPARGGEAIVSDESLFRLLSDSDAGVRAVTAASLGTRGLDDSQIALARKLAHADPTERLSLLFDLRWAGDTVKDPGPWLARLAKDADPAVRAGAARVAAESGSSSADWVNDLADRDPDPLVRLVAGHYRLRQGDVVPVGVR
jgi:hypothetical protein